MYFNKSHIHRIFLLLILYSFNNAQIHSMQSSAKIKNNFDEDLFQQQLDRLPKDLQKLCIAPFFWKYTPKIVNQNGSIADTETILIDYRLIPAFLPHNCLPAIKTTLWSINSRREHGYYRPGQDLKIYQFTGYEKIMSQLDLNLLNETNFIRNNPNAFLTFGYADKIRTYIHASHAKTIEKLTSEQLSFISDLFKAQFNTTKATKLNIYWQRPKIILNEAQTRLFYSLPPDIQINLKKNYHLAASTQAQLAIKAPRVSTTLTQLSRMYTQYDNKPLVRLAKIAIKTGLIYYGLKWATPSKILQNRNGVLLELLNHKKTFIIGTAALIGVKEACGSAASKKVSAIGRFGRKISDFLTLPLM